MVLNSAAAFSGDLVTLLAALFHDVGKGLGSPEGRPGSYPGHEKTGAEIADRMLDRLRVPLATRRFVVAATRNHMKAHRWRELRAGTILELLGEVGALENNAGLNLVRFLDLVDADIRGRALPVTQEREDRIAARRTFFLSARSAALSIRGRDLVAAGVPPGGGPGQVGPRLREARIKAIKGVSR